MIMRIRRWRLRGAAAAAVMASIALAPWAFPAALADGTAGETVQIGSDLSDPNMGGATIGRGMGTNSGDAAVDNKQNAGCTNSHMFEKMISATCWTCIFPIVTLGVAVGGSMSEAPDDRYKQWACMCRDRNGVPFYGFTFGMWQPVKTIELVRMPGCLAMLNGTRIKLKRLGYGGWDMDAVDNSGEGASTVSMSYANYHMYAYPLLIMLKMSDSTECLKDKYMDLDILYMSEVDPTWNSDTIAFFTMPEVVLFANPVAELACSADASSTALYKKPIQSLFWCAGSWGMMYPLTGHVNYTAGAVEASSLMMARVLFVWHRRGLLRTTYGHDSLCNGGYTMHVPKTQYKMTMLYPVPETHSSHVIGEMVLKWGAGRAVPVTGEDFIYLIWTWNDCCLTAAYGSGA